MDSSGALVGALSIGGLGARGMVVSRTWKYLAALTVLLGVGLPIVGAANSSAAAERSPALCADGDANPEPGVQGDVPDGADPEWDCGVHAIGFLPGANGAMAVAGMCAYTGGGAEETPATETYEGVRVIDVADPTEPKLVRVLDTGSRELLAAQVSLDGSRALLATRHRDTVQREGQLLGRDMLVDVWDLKAKGCTDPQLLGAVTFPTQNKSSGDTPAELAGPAHNLKFNPSATKLYGSMPLHEVDLADLTKPASWTIRNLRCSITEQHYPLHKAVPGLCSSLEGVDAPGNFDESPQIDHEPSFNADGSRLYIGGQNPLPEQNGTWILAMDEGPNPVLKSFTDQAPGHSVDFMTVRGHQYLLHSNEIGSMACVPEQVRPRYVGFGDRAFLLDIGDETAPQKTSEIILEDSKFASCGTGGNTGGPTIAYHDIDDPLDSSYAVVNFGPAGFRFFDIRDPAKPVEVAYFNRATSEHTKSYIIPATGHIWVSDGDGFRVLELEPQVIAHLKLAPPSSEACANDGWKMYAGENDAVFKSHGDCVSYVATRSAVD